jgi:hypothetical protein
MISTHCGYFETMVRRWMVIAVIVAHASPAGADDDPCAALFNGGRELELARESSAQERKQADASLKRDPGNLELHHRAIADYVVGKRRVTDVRTSILVFIERCPGDDLLAHPKVSRVQRADLGRAWERSVRRSPSPSAVASYYAYKLRGRPPTIRGRAHEGVTIEQLMALQRSHEQLSKALGKDDRIVRTVARRAHKTGELLLEDTVAARVSQAKMSPVFPTEPEPVPLAVVAHVARAAFAAGRVARAEQLAALVLMSWSSTGRASSTEIEGALSLLAEIAIARGDRSLERALWTTLNERNDPWQ